MRKILLMLCCLSLAACNSSSGGSGGSSGGTVAATGTGTGVWIVVSIRPECSASSATVSLTSNYGSSALQTVTVPNGGSTNFQVAQGTYTLNSQAGSCPFSATFNFTGTVQTFDVCLGTSCTGSSNGVYSSPFLFRAANEVPCSWGVYGCQGTQYPGSGTIVVERASIQLTPKKDMSVGFDLTFAVGNNALVATPALGTQGWTLTAKADGHVVASGATYDSLVYDAQADDKALQFKEGFCDKRENIPAKMSDYLTAAGFSAKSTAAFQAEWALRMPPNSDLCVYPQGENEIHEVVNYKTATTNANKRVWFIVIPQQDAAISKIHAFPKHFAALPDKPAVNALVAMKAKAENKVRAVANDPDLTIEEWGVGFMIER